MKKYSILLFISSFVILCITLSVNLTYAGEQGGCAAAPCDCTSVGGSFHPVESKWCNYQLCVSQCMSERKTSSGGNSYYNSGGVYGAAMGAARQSISNAISQGIINAFRGDPQEAYRKQMEAEEAARQAAIARERAEVEARMRAAEEARKRQETFDRLSSQLQLSQGFDGNESGPALMLGDDGLRPQGTSFFGRGGGAGGSNLNNDSKVVDLRPRQGYSVATAAPANPGDTLPLIMGDPNTDSKVVDLRNKKATYKESESFYALQTKTLTPMKDGGHPIDTLKSPPIGLHGLVGGTTWTYGFQWPHKKCDTKCVKDIERNLADQLALFCSSQSDPKKCLHDGLPFTKKSYDLVVSMGSAHNAIQDLATRVVWDGRSFGEFSRKNANIFASLKGRQFDTLDCHSNGAMLCLAALRSGETTAKTVRLFGPQINPQAAAHWREWAHETGANIEIYINNGDPVPAISWKQPTPQTTVAKVYETASWVINPATNLADALTFTWMDKKTATMDDVLHDYGFKVTRFYPKGCDSIHIIDCHSMLLYEQNAKILPAEH